MSKTIETHLQSKEVRIPKKPEFDVSSSAAPCSYFKSSFARSLSFSQSGGSPYGGAGEHFTRSLDFDVNFGLSTIPDQASSSSSQTTPSASPVYDPGRDIPSDDDKKRTANGISTSNGGIVKTLWGYTKSSDPKSQAPEVETPVKYPASNTSMPGPSSSSSSSPSPSPLSSIAPSGSGSSSSSRKSVEASEMEVLRLRKECQNLIEENRRLMNLAANSGYAINGVMSGGGGGSSSSSSISNSSGPGGGNGSHTSSSNGTLRGLGVGIGSSTAGTGYSNVESVILQTQVETLQWQLKQVDSSRQMYRAVMEEVVRYLDRCYRSLDALQPNIIGRSKSVLQVSKSSSNHHDSDSSSASSPRARSSINLIDVQKSAFLAAPTPSKKAQQQQDLSSAAVAPLANDDECPPPSPAGSYSTFRDFTWRRSPKRTQTLPISSTEVDPEKLAQEAFRLLRTVQNLLNTQEPTLSQSSNGLDSMLLGSAAGSTTGSTTTLTSAGGGPPNAAPLHHHHPHPHALHHPHLHAHPMHLSRQHLQEGVESFYAGPVVVNTRSNVGFSRKLNMRGSRLSLRSSTDDSVHSTSSSNKTETDEDNTDRPTPSPPTTGGHAMNHHLLIHQHQNSASSSTSSNASSTNGGHHLASNHHRHSANIDRIKEMMLPSSAEDESGFSSMNSFQEIGLPLSSSATLASSSSVASSTIGVFSGESNSSAASSTGSAGSFISDESSDARENTVIPMNNVTTIAISSTPSPSSGGSSVISSTTSKINISDKLLSDKLGIPSQPSKAASELSARVSHSAGYEHHTHFINHRRWDSAPVMPPKLKIHHHNGDADGGVSSRVLWV